jgi:Fe-S-cluster containining protein
MRIFLDSSGKMNYNELSPGATVRDLLDAADAFFAVCPPPCQACAHSCCKKSWAVEVDNVAARRLFGGEVQPGKLVLKLNHAMGIMQYVLDKKAACPFVTQENRCTAYGARPLICRLYTCAPKSRRYDQLREMVAATFLRALVMEQNMRRNPLSQRTLRDYRLNPALEARDYAVPLEDVLDYAQRAGWLDEGERRELSKPYEEM